MSNTTDPFQDLADAMRGLARNPFAKLLLYVFLFVEVLNIAVLPAALQTVTTKTAQAKGETASATAEVAKIRQQAEANVATETARIKAEQAQQAERFRQAEAKKRAGEAKRAEEVARNSPAVLAAKTLVARKTAEIDSEKARYEERRAAAEAEKTAYEERIADAQAKLHTAALRSNTIIERSKAMMGCIASLAQRSGGGFGISMMLGNQTRALRRECLPTIQSGPRSSPGVSIAPRI